MLKVVGSSPDASFLASCTSTQKTCNLVLQSVATLSSSGKLSYRKRKEGDPQLATTLCVFNLGSFIEACALFGFACGEHLGIEQLQTHHIRQFLVTFQRCRVTNIREPGPGAEGFVGGNGRKPRPARLTFTSGRKRSMVMSQNGTFLFQ